MAEPRLLASLHAAEGERFSKENRSSRKHPGVPNALNVAPATCYKVLQAIVERGVTFAEKGCSVSRQAEIADLAAVSGIAIVRHQVPDNAERKR
jgi:hypothetical protein